MGLRKLCGERQSWGVSLGSVVRELEHEAITLSSMDSKDSLKGKIEPPASGPPEMMVIREFSVNSTNILNIW